MPRAVRWMWLFATAIDVNSPARSSSLPDSSSGTVEAIFEG